MKKKDKTIEYSSGETVRISDFFQDDPKTLKELGEMKEWIEENEHLFEFPEEKVTQGQLKLQQYLQDVRRDVKLQEKLKKIADLQEPYPEKDLEAFHVLHVLLLSEMARFRKTYLNKQPGYKAKRKFAKANGITPELMYHLLSASKSDRLEGWDFAEEATEDVCVVEPSNEINDPLNIHDFHVHYLEELNQDVFPVKLKLHKYASKRDVLDFINKKWPEVEQYLTKKRITKRKLPRSVVDFIWKHRDKKATEITDLLRAEHPKHILLYDDIAKVIHTEKKRRNIKKA